MRIDLTRESEVLHAVVGVYTTFGCQCQVFQEGRRTRTAAGWPDLLVFCPRKHTHWAHEVKTATGKQSPAQSVVQELAERSGLDYVLGGVQAAQEQLRKVGLIADALQESFRA